MNILVLELLPELLELVILAVGSVGLSVAGLYLERTALTLFEGGQFELGAFVAWFGLVTFGIGYLLATDKVRPRLAELASSLSGR